MQRARDELTPRTTGMIKHVSHIDESRKSTRDDMLDQFFDQVDTDGSGTIDRSEFKRLGMALIQSVHAEHEKEVVLERTAKRSAKRSKIACTISAVLLVIVFLLLTTQTGLIYGLLELTKDMSTRAAGVVAVKGSSDIAKMAEATVAVPLVAAPLLGHEMLDRLKSVRVTRQGYVTNLNKTVLPTVEKYTVSGYSWRSNSSMTVHTTRCEDTIELEDGEAWLRIGTKSYPLCAADVTCSAFKIEETELDVDKLLQSLPARARRLQNADCDFSGKAYSWVEDYDPFKDGKCLHMDKKCTNNLKKFAKKNDDGSLVDYLDSLDGTRDAIVYFSDLLFTRLVYQGAESDVFAEGEAEALLANRQRRKLSHMPMPSICAGAVIGAGLGTSVEALGCFLWSIYNHYPFNDQAFQESFNLFGHINVGQSSVQGVDAAGTPVMTTAQKALWTQAYAKTAFVNIAGASTATDDWNQPMSARRRRALTYSDGGRRLAHLTPTCAASPTTCVTKAEWLAGLYQLFHQYFPDMSTDPTDLDTYFSWACLYTDHPSTCTELTENEVEHALSESCVYDDNTSPLANIHGYTTPAGWGTNCNNGAVTLPVARRRLAEGGRQLGHGGGNTMCHPARSMLSLCDGTSVRIDAARVGDSIRTPAGCEPITAFFHAEADKSGDYHHFTTRNASISISSEHWLFVNGAEADPATVKAGDLLSTPWGPQPVLKVETRVERGAYHVLVPSHSYYVDGVLASTYIAHTPLGVWQTFADGYAALRYRLGVPLTPEGTGPLSITWPLAVYDKLGVPAGIKHALWPITTAAAVLTELANTLAVAPAAPFALLLAAATLKIAKAA